MKTTVADKNLEKKRLKSTSGVHLRYIFISIFIHRQVRVTRKLRPRFRLDPRNDYRIGLRIQLLRIQLQIISSVECRDVDQKRTAKGRAKKRVIPSIRRLRKSTIYAVLWMK